MHLLKIFVLLLVLVLGCADKPTEPELTEEEISQMSLTDGKDRS